MKVGIIAAGLGERLARAGVKTPKPLIPIGGAPLIARVIEAAAAVKTDSVVCIVNRQSQGLHQYLLETQWPVPVWIVRRTTANSLESLFQLGPALRREPFLLFTVDTVFSIATLERFMAGIHHINKPGGILALTRFIDDERPLLVDLGKDRRITAIDDPDSISPYATAGFYYFTPDVFAFQSAAAAWQLRSLRQFLGFLVRLGYPMYGIRVSKTVDVDTPEDIRMAESHVRRHAGIGR